MPRTAALWSEQWHPIEEYLRGICHSLREDGSVVISGGDWDRWDLKVRGGSLGVAKLLVAFEEHGDGRQLLRFAWRPGTSRGARALGGVVASLGVAALVGEAWNAAAIIGVVTALLLIRVLYECGAATAIIGRLVERPADSCAAVLRDLAPLPRD